MAGSWIDDFTAVMGSTADVLEKTSNLLNPTQVNKPPTVTAVEQTPKQALVETKTQLPAGNTAALIAVVAVGAVLLLMEW